MSTITRPRSIPLAALALFGLSLAAPLFAQDIEVERQRPGMEATREKKAVKAAAQAEKMVIPGEEGVTYEQVLAKPDDIDLNYRYALTQIRGGDLKGASATLERILMVNPNMPKVRLLFAVVLYRLDNLAESQRELEQLKGTKLPDEVKNQVNDYLALVKKRQRRTQISGRLSFGWEFDDDRNAAPAGNQALFQDLPLTLSGNSARRSDTSLLFIGNIEGRRDLGFQAGHDVFANFTYYRSEQTLIDTLNLQAYSAQVGATYKTSYVDVIPTVQFDHILLAQTTFLRNHGFGLRLEKKLNRKTLLYVEGKDTVQQYSNTAIVPTAGDRTGGQIDATLGLDYVLGSTMKAGANYTHAIKHAEKQFVAFDRDSLGLHHDWLLGKGTFLLTTLTYNHDQYREPDPFVSVNFRHDDTLRANATFGAPLSLIHPKLKDLIWTATYEYYEAHSSIKNYAYTNNKIASLLTYRWELGL